MPLRNKIIALVVAIVVVVGLVWYGFTAWADSNLGAALAADDPSPAQIKLIVGALSSSDYEIMDLAHEKVKTLGPKALEALVERSRVAGKPEPRVLAARMAMQIDPKVGLAALDTLARDPDTKLRQITFRTLLYPDWKDLEGLGELVVQFTDDPDENIRLMLANNLGAFSAEISEAALKRLLKDSSSDVRNHAQRELKNQAFRAKYQSRRPRR